MERGVCSYCHISNIKLIYEDKETVLQQHYNQANKICEGSYSIPETIYYKKEQD